MFLVDYNPSLLREMDREDGYEDGFANGELESKKQIIKNMLAHGMTLKEIMTLTDCPKELIEDLQNKT